MNKTLMMILSVTIVVLLISQFVTNGLVGVVTAFSTIQERHRVPASLSVYSSTLQLAVQSQLLPFHQSSIQNSDIHYVSLANLTASPLLTDIFKRVENSVVQITSRVNDTGDLQIIINGN